MPFGGLLTLGLIGGGTSLLNGFLGSNASKTAAGQQANAANNALDFQKYIFGIEQGNQQPFISAGQSSIAQLMALISSGKFGPGSLPDVPQFTGTFHTPTIDEARATPGYGFTAQQGSKGIMQGAAAAGGAISGGTLKALDTFNTGLADSTYNDVFNRSLQTYGTGLQAYQANLAGYQDQLAKQAQEYQQLFAPAQLGENATQSINTTGQQVATNAGNLMTQVGNANAAGTIGSTNALTSGFSGFSNSLLQSFLLNGILNKTAPPPASTPAGTGPG